MRFYVSFRAKQSGVEKSVLNRFLHFGPLRGPSVGMTIGAKINYNWYYMLVPVSRSVAPSVSFSSCPGWGPDCASAFRSPPVSRSPDPSAGTYDIMPVNPDMDAARSGRTRHYNYRGRRRSNIDFNLLEGERLSTDYHTTRLTDNHNKA